MKGRVSLARNQQYNVVIVPTSSFAAGDQRFVLSASRLDRGSFLVSPEWTEAEVRSALAGVGLSLVQIEELLRGNRMAFGGRETKLLLFSLEPLVDMGLAPRPVLAEDEPQASVQV